MVAYQHPGDLDWHVGNIAGVCILRVALVDTQVVHHIIPATKGSSRFVSAAQL
jgi:hypothetical protein